MSKKSHDHSTCTRNAGRRYMCAVRGCDYPVIRDHSYCYDCQTRIDTQRQRLNAMMANVYRPTIRYPLPTYDR